MKVCDGVLGIRFIKEYNNFIILLILIIFNDDEYIKDVMKFGVLGYFLKDSFDEVLYEGICFLFFGNIVFDKSVVEKIMIFEKMVK